MSDRASAPVSPSGLPLPLSDKPLSRPAVLWRVQSLLFFIFCFVLFPLHCLLIFRSSYFALYPKQWSSVSVDCSLRGLLGPSAVVQCAVLVACLCCSCGGWCHFSVSPCGACSSWLNGIPCVWVCVHVRAVSVGLMKHAWLWFTSGESNTNTAWSHPRNALNMFCHYHISSFMVINDVSDSKCAWPDIFKSPFSGCFTVFHPSMRSVCRINLYYCLYARVSVLY